MAKAKGIENIEKDLTGNLESDLNQLVRAILVDLSKERYSPVDTGFFASSWTASTQRLKPDEPRETVAPWSNIKPTRRGVRSPQAKIEPRFIDKISYNFKPFSKVFIGNRSQYAARALASDRSKIPQYVQGQLAPLIKRTFTENKPKIADVISSLKGGQGGIGQFADPKKAFVDYTNL